MTQSSTETGAPSEADSGSETETDNNYQVGHGRPPKHTRFAPGTSGNPKGRPKGNRNLDTLILDEAEKSVAVREGGKVSKRSKQNVLVAGLYNLALKGNLRAVDILMSHLQRIQAKVTEVDNDRTISRQEDAIIMNFRERKFVDDE